MSVNYDVLNQAFLKTVNKKNKGAVSAIIFDNEKVLFSFSDGYIDKKRKLVPQEDSLFMIGSNTKILTALGIFRLYEDGKLKLDDPITKYIPEFSVKSRLGEYEVTIENLLMHRAGIQCDLYPYIIGSKYHYTDVIDALKETYRTTIPDTMFSYSNLGYTLLGIIVERASGRPYVQFIQEELLTPLKMEVYFHREEDLPEAVSDRIARSYDKKGKRVIDPLGVLVPAGSNTYTTLSSLAKIGQLIMNEGYAEGRQLYKPETIQFMKSLNIKDELDKELAEVGYGLYHRRISLDYETGRVIGHGGATVFHHSRFNFLEDEKIGVIVFSNFETAPSVVGRVETTLFNTYLKEAGFPKKDTLKRSYVSFDPQKYAKKYDSAIGLIDFTVSENGELTTKLKNIDYSVKLTDDGWLEARPKPIWTKLPPFSKSLKPLRFCQSQYLGSDVLLLEQSGFKQIIGERYIEPNISSAWLKALGTYKDPDKTFKWALEKGVLSVKDGDLIFTLSIEGNKTEIHLTVVNDSEAIVKGFGRNMKETVFLKQNNGKYELTAMGVRLVRTRQKQ